MIIRVLLAVVIGLMAWTPAQAQLNTCVNAIAGECLQLGVSPPKTLVMGMAGPAVPIVNSQTCQIYLPTAVGNPICTLSASNAPSTWAVVAQSTPTAFVLDNSGNLAGGNKAASLPAGQSTVTVTAANANGTSPTQLQTITPFTPTGDDLGTGTGALTSPLFIPNHANNQFGTLPTSFILYAQFVSLPYGCPQSNAWPNCNPSNNGSWNFFGSGGWAKGWWHPFNNMWNFYTQYPGNSGANFRWILSANHSGTAATAQFYMGNDSWTSGTYGGAAFRSICGVMDTSSGFLMVEGAVAATEPTVLPTNYNLTQMTGTASTYTDPGTGQPIFGGPNWANVNNWVLGSPNLQIKEVGLYNRALSQTECQAIATRQHANIAVTGGNSGTLTNGLMMHYNIAKCSGAVASNDLSCPDDSGRQTPNMQLDSAPPVVTITAPANNAVLVGSSITISANVTDRFGISSVQFAADGAVFATDTAAPYTATLNSNLLQDGQTHTITVYGINVASVVGSATINVTANNNGGAPLAPKTYYMSATGNDNNNGTSIGTAWATPVHNIRCEDVILVQPGTYPNKVNLGQWGTVFSCPSPNGVYMAKVQCDSTNVEACVYSGNGAAIDKNNWAMIGGRIDGANSGTTACITALGGQQGSSLPQVLPPASRTGLYVAWINMEIYRCPGGSGLQDYSAVVGSLLWGNATAGSPCFSAISSFKPSNNFPADTGTHMFFAGNYFINNYNADTCTDGEAIILDTFGFPGKYLGLVDTEQNYFLGNGSAAYEAIGCGFIDNTQPTGFNMANMQFHNNTTYTNGQKGISGLSGISQELDVSCSPTLNFHVDHNVMQSTWSGGGVINWQLSTEGNQPAASLANNTLQYNTIFGGGGCGLCPTGTFGTTLVNGAGFNVNTDPVFANTTGMVTSTLGSSGYLTTAPVCNTFSTVYACMQTVRQNFTTTAGTVPAGAGAPPSVGACTPNAYWPFWMHKIVPDGIITKPCGE